VLERQELMQGRVEQPDRDRQPPHLVQDCLEVLTLELAELGQGLPELGLRRVQLGRAQHAAPR
jgi:hypothetical protein